MIIAYVYTRGCVVHAHVQRVPYLFFCTARSLTLYRQVCTNMGSLKNIAIMRLLPRHALVFQTRIPRTVTNLHVMSPTIYIYIYIYISIYICIFIYVYIQIYKYIQIFRCIIENEVIHISCSHLFTSYHPSFLPSPIPHHHPYPIARAMLAHGVAVIGSLIQSYINGLVFMCIVLINTFIHYGCDARVAAHPCCCDGCAPCLVSPFLNPPH